MYLFPCLTDVNEQHINYQSITLIFLDPNQHQGSRSKSTPQDTLSTLNQIKMPEMKKELPYALGLLIPWKKHIPHFSVITRPSYDLL